MDGQMDGQTDGQTYGQTDGQTDGRKMSLRVVDVRKAINNALFYAELF